MDLTAVLLCVRVLHADDVSLGEGDRQRLPRGEGDRRRRIAEDAVQDSLRASFDGHILLIHAHDAGEQIHALFPWHQLPQGLAHAHREGRRVAPVLLHDRPLRRVQRHAVDVQVARQFPLDLLLAHLVSKRPVDVLDMGRQFFLHRIHVPEACLFLSSVARRNPRYKEVRRGGRKYSEWARTIHSLGSLAACRGYRRDAPSRDRLPPSLAGAGAFEGPDDMGHDLQGRAVPPHPRGEPGVGVDSVGGRPEEDYRGSGRSVPRNGDPPPGAPARGRGEGLRAPRGVRPPGILPDRGTRLGEGRSEEHTSELQSPYDLVCRLLLEKKNSLNIICTPSPKLLWTGRYRHPCSLPLLFCPPSMSEHFVMSLS